jgi:acyl-CoA thioester hydrolase
MSEFNYEVEMPVRFRDLDPMGHVNNAAYATYLEQARIEYVENVVEKPLLETGAVVALLELNFEHPIEYDDTVTVAVGVDELGTSSIPVTYEIRANGEVAATAETTMVLCDREAGEPHPIPDDWGDPIEAHEGL